MSDNLLDMDTTATENNSPVRPDGIPEKFWNKDKQEINLDALLQSYLALEKRLSKMVPLPENDDDRRRLQKLLGHPDSADQYNIKVNDDVMDIDADLNARLHSKGFTNEQVQEIYDLATEKFVPMILELASEFQADRELERLVEHFGGADRWTILSKQLQEFGKKNLPLSAYNGLCCSYDGVMALYAMMKSEGNSTTPRNSENGLDMLDEKGLRQLMQQPKYWRDRDPALIAKVSEGFQRLYGER